MRNGNVWKTTAAVAPALALMGAGVLDAQASTVQTTDGVTMVGQAPTHNKNSAQGRVAEQIGKHDAAKAAGSFATVNTVDYDATLGLSCEGSVPKASGSFFNYTGGLPYMSLEAGGNELAGDFMAPNSELPYSAQLPSSTVGLVTRFIFKQEGAEFKAVELVVPDCVNPTPTDSVTPSPTVSATPTVSPTNTFTPPVEITPSFTPTPSNTLTLPPNPEVVNQKIQAAPKKLHLGKAAMLDPVTDRGVKVVWDSKTNKWCKIIKKGGKPAVKATSSKKAAGENCIVVGKAPSSESDNIIVRAASKKSSSRLIK